MAGIVPVKMRFVSAAVVFAFGALAAAAAQASVFVDAKDDIFLAGLSSPPIFPPSQTQTAEPGNGAGLLPVAVSVFGGETLHLTATGLADCGVGCNPAGSGPAGDPEFGTASIEAYGNVGSYTGSPGEGFQLLGAYNVGTTWTPFIIGSGGTFVVPTGATTLYLGLPDGFSFQGPPGAYNDNTGGFTVSGVGVPEPATWAMMLVGFAGLGAAMRSQRKQAAAA